MPRHAGDARRRSSHIGWLLGRSIRLNTQPVQLHWSAAQRRDLQRREPLELARRRVRALRVRALDQQPLPCPRAVAVAAQRAPQHRRRHATCNMQPMARNRRHATCAREKRRPTGYDSAALPRPRERQSRPPVSTLWRCGPRAMLRIAAPREAPIAAASTRRHVRTLDRYAVFVWVSPQRTTVPITPTTAPIAHADGT